MPAPPPVPPRPSAVTVAFALQLGLAGLLLFLAGVVIARAVHYDGLIDEALRLAGTQGATDASFERSSNVAGSVIAAFPALLLSAWFIVTAFWLRRGSNVARILALVGLATPLAAGILLCGLGG